MQEDNKESTQCLVSPTSKKGRSSRWLCCCSSSSVGPTALYSIPADNTILVQEPWYHSTISRKEAERRLTEQEDLDCFLVRKSRRQAGKYIISVSYGGVIKHHIILEKNQCYEVEGTKKSFSQLSELVAYYKNWFLSTNEEKLVNPCPRPILIPRRGTLPGMSKKDSLLRAVLICNGKQ